MANGRPFARYVELAGADAALAASLTSAPPSSGDFVYALPRAALLLPMDAGAKEAARRCGHTRRSTRRDWPRRSSARCRI